MDNTAGIAATHAIMALKARYFRCMDSRDWDGLAAVFTPDLVADFRDATPQHQPDMLIHGAASYLAMLTPMMDRTVTVHHGHMPEINMEDADNARGIWAMEDWVWPGPDSDLPFRALHGWGHYHERYRRTDDGWRIAAIRLTRLKIEIKERK